ncbi:RNA polymerase factor sigma-32 [Bdellovibrio sp. SKB1291214]|uniref:sigma-70 family RNA polymerase sigma factor n=1 Tax=Bdellovibrio sp. SKB1291214 TaxID=1732569 RepID=UPI000B515937|nr:RNA polymerase factor sigma-32 [Bdellovibrio sp. SKB1291214]UYL09182.1 RNA polymerase factor sigma-32 [Bdellovibrio sp. SKB1291214]
MAKTKAKTSSTSKDTKKVAAASKEASPKKPAPKKSPTKEKVQPKKVVAEIVDEDESSDASMEHAEADKAYAVPSSNDEPEFEDVEIEDAKNLPSLDSSKALTSTDPLVMYLNEIRRYKVLTKEEETALAKKYFETKDPEAAQALVKSNLRFVVKVAAEYSKFGAKMIDLIQEGNVGLMHAVREYNPYKGARLITYAVWWIKGYIQEYLMRQYSMVRIGTTQNQRKLFYQLQKEKNALDAMGVEPTTALISSRLGIPEDEVRDMAMRMSGRDVSLDKPVDDDSSTSIGDLQRNVSDQPLDEQLAREEQLEILKQKIEAIRPELSEREKIILDERILNDEPLTLQEIGEKHGITREAVRQMEARLMKKIKSKMEEDEE